jgi:hypothetical protein
MKKREPFTPPKLMPSRRLYYGPHSPFDREERETIKAVFEAVFHSSHPKAPDLAETIERHVFCLESMGELMHQYPSPLDSQSLGERQRGLDTLIDTLSRSTPANFEFFAPTGALIGRALNMAETNFYRLLHHLCREISGEPCETDLLAQVRERLRVSLYTKLIEEVLSDIASDVKVEREIRGRAVAALAQIWAHRLTYRVSDFFPILEATWKARQRIRVTGGTLLGTQEMFELFREGCDPNFVEYFARPNPSHDEVSAFREFLFGTTSEDLLELEHQMEREGLCSISLGHTHMEFDRDPGTLFYEFFRNRFIQAVARRLSDLPGPKRTAEGYVMIGYLQQVDVEMALQNSK